MTVGLLRLSLFIPESNSLKAKRMVLHSLKARLRNNFNISVAQIDDHDKWQRATLAIATVSKDGRNAQGTMSDIVNFVERSHNINLIDYETELV